MLRVQYVPVKVDVGIRVTPPHTEVTATIGVLWSKLLLTIRPWELKALVALSAPGNIQQHFISIENNDEPAQKEKSQQSGSFDIVGLYGTG